MLIIACAGRQIQMRGDPAAEAPVAGGRGFHVKLADAGPRRMKLADLAERLRCELRGDGAIEIRAVRSLEDAGPGDLTFLANRKYVGQVAATKASAIILPLDAAEVPCASLRSANAYLAFAQALGLFHVARRPAP